MVRFLYSWPALPSRSPTTQHPSNTTGRTHGLASLITPILCVAVLWQALLMGLAISVVVSPGNGPGHFNFEKVWIDTGARIAMIFYYPFLPLILLLVSIVDLLRRKTISARRAAFSAAFTTTLSATEFVMWGQCAYMGWGDICWTGSWTYNYQRGSPEMFRHVLPWMALGSGIVYLAFTVFAVVALRRQRNAATSDETYERSLMQQPTKPSFDSSEISFGTVGDQTLPSRTQSTMLSRQQSQAQRSERPPTYYSTGDDSLLTVDEKDEKDGKFGYV